MKNLYIGIGISGSGKSTFLKTMLPNAKYLNADSIREELCGDPSDQSKNKQVFETLYQCLTEDMRWDCWDTVVDNTTLSESNRNIIIKTAFDECDRINSSRPNVILIYFIPNLDTALFRNALRDRIVPPDVIKKQYDKICPPTERERKLYKVLEISI